MASFGLPPESLGIIFGTKAGSHHTLLLLRKFDTLLLQFFAFLHQGLLLTLVLLDLLLENGGHRLIRTREEMVSQHYLIALLQAGIVVDRRVQVKEHRKVYLLLRVQQLVLKAKTLDFVKV